MSEPESNAAMDAAVQVLTSIPGTAWPQLWPELKGNLAVARAVFETLAHHERIHANSLAEAIPVEDVRDLFLWLSEQFPREEDPEYEGAHMVPPRENVAMWRDALLRFLRDSGSREALEQLKYVAGQMNTDWIRWMVIEAESAVRRETWEPISPNDLMRMVDQADAQYVVGPNALLDVLVTSLDSLQATLRGESTAVRSLWNEAARGPTPKNEAALSDTVKRHFELELTRRHLIVNREVEIRGRSHVPGTQELVDIHVDAISSTGDRLRAIVEVKGSWNRDVVRSLQIQLVDRYLVAEAVASGLYLVGWYGQEHGGRTLEELRETLSRSAGEASSTDLLVQAYVLDCSYR